MKKLLIIGLQLLLFVACDVTNNSDDTSSSSDADARLSSSSDAVASSSSDEFTGDTNIVEIPTDEELLARDEGVEYLSAYNRNIIGKTWIFEYALNTDGEILARTNNGTDGSIEFSVGPLSIPYDLNSIDSIIPISDPIDSLPTTYPIGSYKLDEVFSEGVFGYLARDNCNIYSSAYTYENSKYAFASGGTTTLALCMNTVTNEAVQNNFFSLLESMSNISYEMEMSVDLKRMRLTAIGGEITLESSADSVNEFDNLGSVYFSIQ